MLVAESIYSAVRMAHPTLSMRTVGTAQDGRRFPRLLWLSAVAQGCGCTPRLLYFAAVRAARLARSPVTPCVQNPLRVSRTVHGLC